MGGCATRWGITGRWGLSFAAWQLLMLVFAAGPLLPLAVGNVVQVSIPESHIGFQVGEALQVC